MKFFLSLLCAFFFTSLTLPDYNGFKPFTLSIPGSEEFLQFVPVQGGKFIMGNNSISSESPEHEAEVSDFWMSAYEITWQQYDLFVAKTNQSNLVSESRLRELGIDGISSATQPYTDMSFGMGKDKHPAVNMTQYAAIMYCQWLSALTGDFYRLPTEAEWEFAARGGKFKDYDKIKDALQDYAWLRENSGSNYHPVGLKKPNSLGLYDLLGNVAEWTMDAYEKYSAGSKKDFWKVPEKLYPRVARGGSWKDDMDKITATVRIPSQPEWKIRDPQLPKSRWWHTNAPFVGFRIVKPRIRPPAEEIIKYWIKPIEDYN